MASFNQTGSRQEENEGISDVIFRTEWWQRPRDLSSNPDSTTCKLYDSGLSD